MIYSAPKRCKQQDLTHAKTSLSARGRDMEAYLTANHFSPVNLPVAVCFDVRVRAMPFSRRAQGDPPINDHSPQGINPSGHHFFQPID